jgi:hypothetical protein
MTSENDSSRTWAKDEDDSYSLSSYGAFMLAHELPNSSLHDVFEGTSPNEIRRLADSLETNLLDKDVHEQEQQIKEIAYLKYYLHQIAYDNEERAASDGEQKSETQQATNDGGERGNLFGD